MQIVSIGRTPLVLSNMCFVSNFNEIEERQAVFETIEK